MGTFDSMKQKAEGTIDEIKGDFQIKKGEKIKGGMTKMGGKLKKATAPLHEAENNK